MAYIAIFMHDSHSNERPYTSNRKKHMNAQQFQLDTAARMRRMDVAPTHPLPLPNIPCGIEPFRHRPSDAFGDVCISSQRHWREAMDLIEGQVNFMRKKCTPKQILYSCGKALDSMYLIYSGSFKMEYISSEGRTYNAEILLDGDWLGFDAIYSGNHTCTATALDYGEVWVVNYESLLRASAKYPALLAHLVGSISKSLAHNRDQSLSNASLNSAGRVADFLLRLALDFSKHGRRSDVIMVPLTRAEIGDFLGLRIETVSRAICRLEGQGLIKLDDRDRRQISIPNLGGLRSFVQDNAGGNSANSQDRTEWTAASN